eukprot:Hpha_TRINITY_DN11488_c0_g1::TRINITY_DN11488_c0_g1_i2::g.137328::m.137328
MPNVGTPTKPKSVVKRMSSAGAAKVRRLSDGEAPAAQEGLGFFADVDPSCAAEGAQQHGPTFVEVDKMATCANLHTELRRSKVVKPTPIDVVLGDRRLAITETLADAGLSAEARVVVRPTGRRWAKIAVGKKEAAAIVGGVLWRWG